MKEFMMEKIGPWIVVAFVVFGWLLGIIVPLIEARIRRRYSGDGWTVFLRILVDAVVLYVILFHVAAFLVYLIGGAVVGTFYAGLQYFGASTLVMILAGMALGSLAFIYVLRHRKVGLI